MTRRGLMGTAPIDYGQGETLNDPARLDEKALLLPLSWKKPRKIFVCSMTDLFGSWVPAEWLDRIFGVMALATQHTFIVLTKRPTIMRNYLSTGDPLEDRACLISREAGHIGSVIWDSRGSDEWKYATVAGMPGRAGSPERLAHLAKRRVWPGWPLPNVWVGATIESDQYAWRADRLRQTPAAVRWISAEPLLSGLPSLNLDGIDWLVTGGESGPKARPSDPEWYRDLRDRSAASGTAYFHKQWGAYVWPSQAPDNLYRDLDAAHNLAGIPEQAYRVGNHKSGRLLDGREHNAFPSPAVPTAGPGGAL